MHDVGKIALPDTILKKKGKLTPEEKAFMENHTKIGVKIFNNAKSPMMRACGVIALTHHERFDGSGYPGGYVGTETPVFGRIAAIIDCYDAMTSKRPYGEPISPHSALQEIYNWRDKYFQRNSRFCLTYGGRRPQQAGI